MKRIFSLLLAAALTAVLLVCPAAAADTAPWVQIDNRGTASQTVSVRGLSGNYNGIQLTLELDRAPVEFFFDESVSGEGGHATYSRDGNSITIYATTKGPLNQGDTITLGALAADEGFNVISASGLKLVSMDPGTAGETVYDSVELGGSNQGGNTGDGSGSIGGGPGVGPIPSQPQEPAPTVLPFEDVTEADWFHEAVAYVYDTGLMNGTSGTAFSPNAATSRGMIVTILYRLEGSPAVGAAAFPDVPEGWYYTDAVAWAAENGIVTGFTNGLFGPNYNITREQMATILYRYAQYKGLDVSAKADLSAFVDAGQVSGYAMDAMAWANQAGLINGMGGGILQPGGSATRAQAAAILMRFCELEA